MSDIKHTPGPWRQGVLLLTETTRRWSDEERRRGADHESLRVFAQFSEADEGRSRVHVALVRSAADACLIAAAPELLDVMTRCEALLSSITSISTDLAPFRDSILRQARAAIAKAEGKP